MPRPTYALTPGDALGIGYELALKQLAAFRLAPPPFNLQLFADETQWQQQALALGIDSPPVPWVQFSPLPPPPETLATPTARAGWQSAKAIELAVAAMASGSVAGLATGPICKQHWWEAGYHYSGHTEWLEALAQQQYPCSKPYQSEMVFSFEAFRLLLLTRHVPLAVVSQQLKSGDALQSLQTFAAALTQAWGIDQPRLALLGLNPHAGEIGGEEEATLLAPLREAFNASGQGSLSAPLPADAYFRGFSPLSPPHDGVVACYHDQGLIPMKLLAGLNATNITLGLPFIRTSVSHGTAFDIAGKGLADPTSLAEALTCLHRLVQGSLKETQPC